MRKFSYITDYGLINSSVRGYIIELEKELAMLIDMEDNNDIYIDAYRKLKEFKNKYSDLYGIYNRILNDLTSGDNVEYCFKYGKYKDDASLVGLEFEKDLKEIFELEEKCRDYSIKLWERDITNYDNYLEPGVKGDSNYHDNEYSKQYLSCCLISDRELNTFGDLKTLFVMDVNSDSYIASSFVDSVTSESTKADFNTLKEVDVDGKKHYIRVGYTNDMKSSVTSISSPKMIEELSIKRELKDSKELYRYNSQTNEVVLDRTKTRVVGALLLSNGCDMLLGEYINLKQMGIRFKCINKGLYRQKNNISPYNEDEYNKFIINLDSLDEVISRYNISDDLLREYYYEVVLSMKYDDNVMKVINKKFSLYLPEIASVKGK